MNHNSWILMAICLALGACKNGNCRDNRPDGIVNAPMTDEQKKQFNKVVSEKTRVRVAIGDGSVQCKKDSGISEATAKSKLDKIEIFSSAKKHDGLMRTMVCGAGTGQFYVFEIEQKDLQAALKKGFIEWTAE